MTLLEFSPSIYSTCWDDAMCLILITCHSRAMGLAHAFVQWKTGWFSIMLVLAS